MALYPDWDVATAYSAGDKVKDDGVIYQATASVTGGSSPSTSTTGDWEAVAINKIQSYNSLIEAVKLEINTSDEMINDSIPLFIQMAEESFTTRLRVPIQRVTTVVAADAQSRIEIPQDLLQVINLRHNSSLPSQSDLLDRGRIEILAGNIEEYLELKQLYDENSRINSFTQTAYEAPVYWYDDGYFYISPTYAEGEEFELIYYASIPQLGSTVFIVNANGEPLNSAGQTTTQWVAEGGGNTVDNFVQDTQMVTQNWYTNSAPQMLLFGSLVNADLYLKDDTRIEQWQQKFERAELETKYKVEQFEAGRAHTIQIGNFYSN